MTTRYLDDLNDDIRNVEDLLNILKDERDIKARGVVHDAFSSLNELEEEGRRLGEWLEDEKIKIMEQQLAQKQQVDDNREERE